MSSFGEWWSQLLALSMKNALMFKRSPIYAIVACVVFPALIPLLQGYIDQIKFNLDEPTFEDSYSLNQLPSDSMIYFSPATDESKKVMLKFAQDNNLEYSKKVVGFETQVEMAQAIFDRYIEIQMYEIFSAVSFSPESSPADGKIVYNIWNWQDDYKRSKDAAVSLNLALPKLQLALDNAILSVIAKETNSALSPKLTANLKWMEPYNIEQSSSSTSSGESYQQFGMMGLASAFYAFAFFPLLTYISSTVLYEKTNKLLGPIRRMGLMESAYWMSALFFAMMCSLVASSVFSLSVYLTGQHYDVGFFKKIDISILWIVCFLYAIGISSFGLLISSMFSRNMFILLIQSLVLISFFVVGFLGVFTSFQPLLHGEAFDLFRAFIPWLSFQKFISDSYVQLSFVKFNQSITWSNITTPLINSRLDREAKEYKIVNSFDNLGSMVFVYQVLAIFTVFILTWYFAQVLNTEEGFSLRWNFPFTSEYWTGKNVNSGNKVMDVNDTAERERALSEEEQSIRTMKISKTYKGTAAVKELTLQMQKGNIYSLLGHNGSGKTTTIGLLSGVTEPTFGEAFVLGHDVRKEMRSIASKTGNCNQFDLLYPFLTAYQHFVFYAKFRSVRLDALQSLDEYIFEKLKTVDLDDVAHKPVGGFSGGMKRRLSLMLSTVGNDLELLFLDEPTTGLDPLSRRKVWEAIKEMKKNRIVVLTTHSMEEADYLSDHIFIMHMGNLKASGSASFLKKNYGKGFQISLLCSSTNPSTSQIQTALEKWVTDALPGSEILSSAAGALTVGVGKNNGDHLNKFLRCIQTDKYMEWSLSNSTLEEVFLKLCATNSGVNKQVIAEGRSCQLCAVNPAERVNLYTVSGIRVVVTDVICSDCAHKTAAEQKSASVSSRALESDQVLNFNSYLIKELESSTPSFSTVAASTSSKAHDLYTLSAPNSNTSTEGHDVAGNERSQAPLFSQIFAIFLKNCTMEVLQRRKLNIATIFLAVVTIACKVLINMQFSKADAPGCSVVLGEPPGPYTSPAYYGCSATALVKYMEPELLQLNYDRDKATVDGSFTTSWDIEGDSIYQIENQNGTKLSLSQYLTNSQSDVFVPLLIMESPNPQDLSLHDSVRWTPRKSYQSPQDIGNVETSSGKITVKRSSPSQSMGQYLISQQQMISSNKQALSAFCSSSEGFLVSNSSQLMSILPVTYPQVAIDVAGYDQTLNLKLDIYFKKSLSYKIAKTRGSSQFPSIFLSDPNLNSPHCTSLTARQILYSSYMNYQSEPNMVQILESANIMTNSLLSKALGVNTNPASPLGASVASSKQPNIKAKFSNLPKVSRNVISPFLSVAIAMIATCFMFPRLTSLFVEERISGLSEMMRIQGISPPVYWLGNLIFGFTVIGAFCLVTFAAFIGIDSSSRGVAFVLLVAFVLWAASQVVLVVLLSRLVSSTSSSNMVSIMFYLISTIASIILVGGESDTNTGSLPLTYCIFPPFAFASTVNTALLGKAVNTIGPTFGVWIASIVVIGILGISAQLSSRLNIKGMLGGDSSSNSSEENGGKTASLHVDPDVAREEQEIQQSLYHMKTSLLQKDATNSAIKLFHLRKEYKDKVAVKDLSLNIKYGETFGLLGPNGAGKSTTISCFTGLERSTSGLIQIDGTSLEDIKHIWKLVGVCPQHDSIWANLSVEQHLKFYCRSRGVPSKLLNGAVRKIAEEVELDGDAYRKLAGALSGGMKRRLSIAIAMCGSPKIMVLDEPTTGLDPDTRQHIWKLVSKVSQRPDRCVVITTHSMEEADALCSRIGIVCSGRLKVVGNQIRLKNNYGNVVKLFFKLNMNFEDSDFYPGSKQAMLDMIVDFEQTRIEQMSTLLRKVVLKNTVVASTSGSPDGCSNKTLSEIGMVLSQNSSTANELFSNKSSTRANWQLSLEFTLDKSMIDLAMLFSLVEENVDSLRISDWGISPTTLEDVFVKVVERDLAETAARH